MNILLETAKKSMCSPDFPNDSFLQFMNVITLPSGMSTYLAKPIYSALQKICTNAARLKTLPATFFHKTMLQIFCTRLYYWQLFIFLVKNIGTVIVRILKVWYFLTQSNLLRKNSPIRERFWSVIST